MTECPVNSKVFIKYYFKYDMSIFFLLNNRYYYLTQMLAFKY